jgi:hypothetical protein
MRTSTTIPWAEEPDDDARRIAWERQQRIKEAPWISVDRALEIQVTTDPTHLRKAIKEGLPCCFRHRNRWWQTKPVEQVAPLLGGRNPLDLQDQRWELVVHERYWRERLGKPAASATAADAPPPVMEQVQLQDATDGDIRDAMRAVYDEMGGERPNTKKIVSPVRDRLKSKGLYASRDRVGDIAGDEEFINRRNPSGRTKKSRQSK